MKKGETKTEQIKVEKAFILTAKFGTKLFNVLNELPIKYSQSVVPLIDELQKSHRGDVTLNKPI